MTGINIGGRANAPTPPTAVLYGALGGSSTTSDLYTIDSGTGAATSIGPIGFAVTGLAEDPTTGIMYGVTSQQSASDPASLISVNKTTGAGTLIGSLSGGVGLADISFSSAGVLYGYEPFTPRTLHTVNLATGVATQVSATAINTPASGFGMSFDSADSLYLFPKTSSGIFYLIDETNGAQTAQPTLTGAPASSAPIPAAAFDPGDVCYIVINDGATYYLATVDIGTAVVTNVGTTVTLLDAIEWGT